MENPHSVTAVTSTLYGWLDFLARLVDALAWPAIILAALLIFRKEIKQLISSIKKLKWGENEAIIEGIDRAKEAAKGLNPSDGENIGELKELFVSLRDLAKVHPVEAIDQAYNEVSKKMNELGRIIWTEKVDDSHPAIVDLLPRERSHIPDSATNSAFLKSGWITKSEYTMIESLRETRNNVMYTPTREGSYAVSIEFINLAERLINSLSVKIKSLDASKKVIAGGT